MFRLIVCRRSRRDFSSYLNGELSPLIDRKLEEHLMDCGECRSRLARLRAGARLARRVPSFKPAHDRWPEIQAELDRYHDSQASQVKEYRSRTDSPMISARTAILVLAALGAALLSIHYSTLRAEEPAESIDKTAFHDVSIAGIDGRSEAHIAVEGYVAEVRIDSEENTLSFKLVPNLKQPKPFVICEIIRPLEVTLPLVGSQVRVYGISRYDGQPDHQWYEIHPVMKIEIMKQ